MLVSSLVHLPDREAAFVDALAKGARLTTAAREAGYSVAHAAALLQKSRVRTTLLAISSNATAALREAEARTR